MLKWRKELHQILTLKESARKCYARTDGFHILLPFVSNSNVPINSVVFDSCTRGHGRLVCFFYHTLDINEFHQNLFNPFFSRLFISASSFRTFQRTTSLIPNYEFSLGKLEVITSDNLCSHPAVSVSERICLNYTTSKIEFIFKFCLRINDDFV